MAYRLDMAGALEIIDGLRGEHVKILVRGQGEDAAPVVQMDGELWRQPTGSELLPDLVVDSAADSETEAVALGVMPNAFARVLLWPDRFVSAEALDRPDGIKVNTLDAEVSVYRNRPWVD